MARKLFATASNFILHREALAVVARNVREQGRRARVHFLGAVLVWLLVSGISVVAQERVAERHNPKAQGLFNRAEDWTGGGLNRPVPERARRLQQEGRRLVVQEKLAKAEAKFRRALQLAPQFVQAHLDLVRFRAYYLQDVAGAEAEYRALAAAEPESPLFVYVLATGLKQFLDAEEEKGLLRQAAELAPEWSWAHRARSLLLEQEGKYEGMARELEQFLVSQPESRGAWVSLAGVLERRLERWTEAERAYRKWNKLRGVPFSAAVWRMKLRAAGESQAARVHLRRELERWRKTDLAPQYRMQIASAYRALLDDAAAAQAIEEAVKRNHPDWGRELYGFETTTAWILPSNMDGPERVLAGGRHVWFFRKLNEAMREKDALERVGRIRALMEERPHPGLQRLMQQYLLKTQIEEKDWPGARATLAELVAGKPETVENRFKLALALAENKMDLDQALRLVEEAKALRREFRPWVRSKQFAAGEWEKRYGSLESQRRAYNDTMATLADEHGWMLAEQGKLEQAEQELRISVSLRSSQQVRYRLGVVLGRRGKSEEALDLLVQIAAQGGFSAKAAREAAEIVFEKRGGAGLGADVLIERVHKALVEEKRQELAKELIQEPSKDFELVALDGQSYRLSSLRGEVVLINFWATWCVGCVAEMPTLVRLYQKYREEGFEILAISSDSDESKVPEFVSKHKVPFPVMLDKKVGQLYEVDGIPQTFFVDRAGNLRYHIAGFSPGSDETALEAVVEELLASPP